MANSFLLNYLPKNLMGSKQLGTANVLPAVLTTVSNLFALQGNETSYDLYKQQARSYVDAAKQNAQLIKEQGEIELRNLRYKNKLARGNDVVTVAGKGGNMSGSNLDVLVQKEKVRLMNETVVKGNYANQVMIEMSNGYRKAANAYGQLSAKAGADKWGAIAAIMKGVEVYVNSSVKDAKTSAEIRQTGQMITDAYDEGVEATKRRYGIKDDTTSETPTSLDIGPVGQVINEQVIGGEVSATSLLSTDQSTTENTNQTEIKFN